MQRTNNMVEYMNEFRMYRVCSFFSSPALIQSFLGFWCCSFEPRSSWTLARSWICQRSHWANHVQSQTRQNQNHWINYNQQLKYVEATELQLITIFSNFIDLMKTKKRSFSSKNLRCKSSRLLRKAKIYDLCVQTSDNGRNKNIAEDVSHSEECPANDHHCDEIISPF